MKVVCHFNVCVETDCLSGFEPSVDALKSMIEQRVGEGSGIKVSRVEAVYLQPAGLFSKSGMQFADLADFFKHSSKGGISTDHMIAGTRPPSKNKAD